MNNTCILPPPVPASRLPTLEMVSSVPEVEGPPPCPAHWLTSIHSISVCGPSCLTFLSSPSSPKSNLVFQNPIDQDYIPPVSQTLGQCKHQSDSQSTLELLH